MSDRQRLEQHGIHNREERDIRPDPERENHDCSDRERGRTHQPARSLANVAQQRLEPLPTPGLARMVAHDARIAEKTQRRMARLGLVHTRCAIFCDLLFEMEAQLVIERGSGRVALEERAADHSESIEQAHRGSP